jgi:hypothetical protein
MDVLPSAFAAFYQRSNFRCANLRFALAGRKTAGVMTAGAMTAGAMTARQTALVTVVHAV